MIKILFICHGNICRSPMAEFVMKKLVRDAGREAEFEIASAATSYEEIGNPVYPPARRELAAHGITCAGKTARHLEKSDYDAYDLLIGMERVNLRNMQRICGGDPAGKMHLLRDYSDDPGEIDDPWYTGRFGEVYGQILAGCRGLLESCGAGNGGPARIVDFHTHTFPDKIADRALSKLRAGSHTATFTDGTAAGLQRSMKRAGIDLSVVLPVATSAAQTEHINDRAMLTHRSAGETGVDSFGAAHPDDPNWERELERIAAGGLRGIKIHPPYQGVDMDDPRYLRILDKAGTLGLTVVTHAGLDVGLPGAEQALPEKIRRAVKSVGPVRLVCAHMGGWKCWDAVCDCLADTEVMLDISFSLGRMTPDGDGYPWTDEELERLTEEEFVRMTRLFGAERILFGTDSPWEDQAESLARFRRLPLSAVEQEMIVGGSAARLLYKANGI